MSIVFKIMLGLLLLIAFVVGGLFVVYFSVVAFHEWTWRNKIDENYEAREKESSQRQG